MKHRRLALLLSALVFLPAAYAQENNEPPEGAVALFNGEDLSGWWGLGTEHYNKYAHLSPEDFAARQEASREDIRKHWKVEDGVLVNDGRGLYLTTDKFYGDFELWVDYKTVARADSGIYLRGIPQVQIWDYTDEKKFKIGADKGSGGLWNNPKDWPGKDPSELADKPFGEWNRFHITMVGEYVTVELNGKRIVDHARMSNYFDRKAPMPKTGPIQLQTHGGEIQWRNVFLREIGAEEATETLRAGAEGEFEAIFNGRDFAGWKGPLDRNSIEDGCILSHHGTIFTEAEYGDFEVRFDFVLPAGGNNGLAIRYPGAGDTAYKGMCELQVLDNTAKQYAGLKEQQYHGSVYGMVAAKRGYLRPVGEWNHQVVTVAGSAIKVELNGFTIVDADLEKVDPATFMYPAEKFQGRTRTKGHFGFAGHGAPIRYRNVEIRELR